MRFAVVHRISDPCEGAFSFSCQTNWSWLSNKTPTQHHMNELPYKGGSVMARCSRRQGGIPKDLQSEVENHPTPTSVSLTHTVHSTWVRTRIPVKTSLHLTVKVASYQYHFYQWKFAMSLSANVSHRPVFYYISSKYFLWPGLDDANTFSSPVRGNVIRCARCCKYHHYSLIPV